MDNLLKSLYVNPSEAGSSSSASVASTSTPSSAFASTSTSVTATKGKTSALPLDLHLASVDQLIALIHEPQHREDALFFLNKKREASKDLALPLWNSFNTIFILLKEATDTYKLLEPSKLTAQHSNRVCNALALFQCVASHPETRMPFIKAKIPMYLYPFLNTTENEKPFDYLRLTSLGVIGALVKVPGPSAEYQQVIHFLLETEVFPLCLRCMEFGNELSKTVATYVISKILMQEQGLKYCCGFAERYFAVAHVLEGMLEKLVEQPSTRLLKHIIFCYLRLTDMSRAREALKRCFPTRLTDDTFTNIINEDPITKRCLEQLVYNVMNSSRSEETGETSGSGQSSPKSLDK